MLARRNWWAFRKPVRPPVPQVSGNWARTPIDAFILEALRSKNLAPTRPLARVAAPGLPSTGSVCQPLPLPQTEPISLTTTPPASGADAVDANPNFTG